MTATNAKAVSLIEAIKSNDEAGLSTILALGDTNVDVNALGMTPLIAAAESGLIAILKLLLGYHARPNQTTTSGNYPLRSAITGGDGECIMELISSGADVNMETARGTPLSTAAGLGDVSTIRLLVEHGARIDHELRDGLTALMVATREDQREAVKALLQLGANPDLKSVDTGRSACDMAEEMGFQEVYGLLMQSSIVSAASSVLEESERRQLAARTEREKTAAIDRDAMANELAAHRAENQAKIISIKAESEELLSRLGLSKATKQSDPPQNTS